MHAVEAVTDTPLPPLVMTDSVTETGDSQSTLTHVIVLADSVKLNGMGRPDWRSVNVSHLST